MDAHMGYRDNFSVVGRLDVDVFAPARTAGYEEIWLLCHELSVVPVDNRDRVIVSPV